LPGIIARQFAPDKMPGKIFQNMCPEISSGTYVRENCPKFPEGNLSGDLFREKLSGKLIRNFFREVGPEISPGRVVQKFLAGNLPVNLAHRNYRREGGFSQPHLVSREG